MLFGASQAERLSGGLLSGSSQLAYMHRAGASSDAAAAATQMSGDGQSLACERTARAQCQSSLRFRQSCTKDGVYKCAAGC